MRKRNTESIGEVLRQFFEENQSVKRKIAESRVLTGWSTLLGQSIASYTTNIYLRNGILYVQLSSSVLRAELLMYKEKLRDNLNKHAGMEILQDIVIR